MVEVLLVNTSWALAIRAANWGSVVVPIKSIASDESDSSKVPQYPPRSNPPLARGGGSDRPLAALLVVFAIN